MNVNSEKQVHVFISSTFRDMHAERDHLVTIDLQILYFPRCVPDFPRF